jgi:hypothetical protein
MNDRYRFRAYCQFCNGEYGFVYFDDDQHAFGVKTIRQTVTSSFGLNKLISEIEIIGNIHENHELLEE